MANWRLYTGDAAVFRYADASATHYPNQAPFLVASNPASVWSPGTFATPKIGVDLGITTDLVGVGLSGHNLGGETVSVYNGGSLLGTSTLLASKTILGSALNGQDTIITFPSTGVRYITVYFTSTLGSNHYLGAMSALTADGLIEMEKESAALYGGQLAVPGYAELSTGGGVRLRQISGSTQRVFELTFPHISTEDGEVGHRILDLFERSSGFANGVWLTDFSFGESTSDVGAGYYCTLAPGTDLAYPSGPVGQQATFLLTLQEMSRGLQ